MPGESERLASREVEAKRVGGGLSHSIRGHLNLDFQHLQRVLPF